jgi:hypothetical protein
MPASTLHTNITRFYSLNTKRKALEKEEAAVKAFFKDLAGGAEAEFEHKGIVVKVSQDQQTRVDLDALRLKFGKKLAEYEKTVPIEKVTVGKVATA